MGKIFCVIGKSSSGKDSIFAEIKKRMPKLKDIVTYTTRPIREGEKDGREYHFVEESVLHTFEKQGRVIEQRSYHTQCGIWHYFTADDGQISLDGADYLVIGTLESYVSTREYFGTDAVVPLYVEVEDGLRLFRALERERTQQEPKYAEMCRRFLADSEDFSEENLKRAGIQVRFENLEFEDTVQKMCRYIREKMAP